MENIKYHLLGLAHVPTHPDIVSCAYTQKIIKLARMLRSAGKTVYFYGTEGSQVACTKQFVVGTAEERVAAYGDYNWRKEFFKQVPEDSVHRAFNARAGAEIAIQKSERDFLLCPMGHCDEQIAKAAGLELTVESGIGYSGVFAKYRVWESYAWMHYIYGLTKQPDGSWFDTVIPNYWDPSDFDIAANTCRAPGYFLFIGRLISRKGLSIAVDATKRMGARLIVAGQGDLSNVEGRDLRAPHVTHVGVADRQLRAELMTQADAVFVPTSYIGPFEGVHIEANMCGTPVITTDWGVFAETVENGVNGFRCSVFNDFLWAMRRVNGMDRVRIREEARKKYSLDAVWPMYAKYFDRLQDIFEAGWYQEHDTPPTWL